MKYYLIAGEASGDLHASRLMSQLKAHDPQAHFRYFGGDLMAAEGGTLVKHYRDMAYMGFVPVLLHLPTILRNMSMCKQDISQWQPDIVILVDYPGFNLDVAKYVKGHSQTPVCYYISPKIWAWKEYRIRRIKRDVDLMLSILPFEKDFYEGKHHYPITYVGNPTMEEVSAFRAKAEMGNDDFLRHNVLSPHGNIIAVLCGSRRQEIKDNLPAMLQATDAFSAHYQAVIAGAPGIEADYYAQFTRGHHAKVLPAGNTYQLLYNARAALVTSGTATLETALMRVPQVVCYETPLPALIGWLRKRVLSVKYISLVDLIADSQVVSELVADTFTVDNIKRELSAILSGPAREKMLRGYDVVAQKLGDSVAPEQAALRILSYLGGDSAQ